MGTECTVLTFRVSIRDRIRLERFKRLVDGLIHPRIITFVFDEGTVEVQRIVEHFSVFVYLSKEEVRIVGNR